ASRASRAGVRVWCPSPACHSVPLMKKTSALAAETSQLLSRLGVSESHLGSGSLICTSPIDGGEIARVVATSAEGASRRIGQAHAAFRQWRNVPAPKRGELVRLLGEELRRHQEALGRLVCIEAGKITSEGLGEVQEMIDICDFAVGLSRQIHGL